MKINDAFYVFSGKRIKESDVYEHQGEMPCATAQTANSGITWKADEQWILSISDNNESVVDAPCITWTKDGVYAGTLFYRDYKFYANDHCGILIPRDEYKDKINLKWFVYTKQKYIKTFVTASQAQGMLYNEQMANIDIEFPEIAIQNKYVQEYDKIYHIINKLEKTNKRIDIIRKGSVAIGGQKEKINNIFHVKTGKVLVEETLYQHQGSVPYITSKSIDNGTQGYVDIEYINKNISKYSYQEEPCISWAIDGNAGSMFYQETPFVYNNHCGILVVKEKYKKKINLKWFLYTHEDKIKSYSIANGSVGKLGKEQMSYIEIEIPEKTAQDEIVVEYEKLMNIKKGLIELITKLSNKM